jgi:pilus assembly protein FimV
MEFSLWGHEVARRGRRYGRRVPGRPNRDERLLERMSGGVPGWMARPGDEHISSLERPGGVAHSMDRIQRIETAAKLVAKRAYDEAIQEYQKLLEADPKDVRILQELGELYQTKNEKNDTVRAAHFFTRVAEGYSADGFLLQAVAFYKQALQLDPDARDVYLRLAELHQELGLPSEAEVYTRLAAHRFDTPRQRVASEPEEMASKLELGELYARAGLKKEASRELAPVVEYFKRNHRTEDWRRVAERLSMLEPNNVALANDLARHYLQCGKLDDVMGLLEAGLWGPRVEATTETYVLLAQYTQHLKPDVGNFILYKLLADTGSPEDAEAVQKYLQEQEKK